MATPYKEQRSDQRWQQLTKRIRDAAGSQCVRCGATTELSTHHGYYHTGRKVWEYDEATLWCLCWPCHNELQPLLTEIHIRIATINPKHYPELLEVIRKHTAKFKPALTQVEIGELIVEVQKEDATRFSAYSVTLYQNSDLGSSAAPDVSTQASHIYPGLTIDIIMDDSHRDCTAYVDGPDEAIRQDIQLWFDRRQENT